MSKFFLFILAISAPFKSLSDYNPVFKYSNERVLESYKLSGEIESDLKEFKRVVSCIFTHCTRDKELDNAQLLDYGLSEWKIKNKIKNKRAKSSYYLKGS